MGELTSKRIKQFTRVLCNEDLFPGLRAVSMSSSRRAGRELGVETVDASMVNGLVEKLNNRGVRVFLNGKRL